MYRGWQRKLGKGMAWQVLHSRSCNTSLPVLIRHLPLQ